MPTVEERLAYLEGRAEEQAHAMTEFRDVVRQINQRIDGLSARVDALDVKIDRFREELAGRIDRVDVRLDGLDQKLTRGFFWVVGMQVTVLLAIVGTLLQASR